jgi:hypothetical protein
MRSFVRLSCVCGVRTGKEHSSCVSSEAPPTTTLPYFHGGMQTASLHRVDRPHCTALLVSSRVGGGTQTRTWTRVWWERLNYSFLPSDTLKEVYLFKNGCLFVFFPPLLPFSLTVLRRLRVGGW